MHVSSSADNKIVSGANTRIRVVDLVKSYRRHSDGGTVVPVDHVTMDVAVNEMLVLLGPSGCGKTTLLRCVAGLERPDSGEIYINDELVYSSRQNVFLPPNKRAVSMVFQSYALWPHMTLFENVAYPLRARGVAGSAIPDRVMRALSVVGLESLAQQYPGQISGGQQQRVALARAVVPETGVVLFDEPLSNVDAKVREQLRLEIRNMQRALEFSALYVTHDQNEAMAVADRIAVLGDGVVEQIGSSETIYDLPNSLYVGTFIGGANTIKGTVCNAGSAQYGIKSALGEISIDGTSEVMSDGQDFVAESDVIVLVRPERIQISTQRPDLPNTFECTVDTRIFLGSHVEYFVQIAGGQRLRANVTTRETIEEGSRAWVTLPADQLRLIHAG